MSSIRRKTTTKAYCKLESFTDKEKRPEVERTKLPDRMTSLTKTKTDL